MYPMPLNQNSQVRRPRRPRQPREVLKGERAALGELCARQGARVGGDEHGLAAELHRPAPCPLLLPVEGGGGDHLEENLGLPRGLPHPRAAGVRVEEPGGDLQEEAGGPDRAAQGGRGADRHVGGEVEEGGKLGQGKTAVVGGGEVLSIGTSDEDSFRKYCFSKS